MKRRHFLTLTLLTASSIVVSSCFKSGPGKTVEKFHRALEKGEIENAKMLISSSAESTLPDDKMNLLMNEAVKQMKEKQGIKSFKIDKEEITGETATVSYTIEYGDNTVESDVAELIQENGEWKLSPTGK